MNFKSINPVIMTIQLSVKLFFASALLFSCNQKSNLKEEYIVKLEKENEIYRNRIAMDSINKISQSSKPITSSKAPALPSVSAPQIEELTRGYSPYEIRQFEIAKSIKSYAHFLRKYFAINSTEYQVLKVQGQPDDVVKTDSKTEVWFYGDCEIIFTNGKVTEVVNKVECLQYYDCQLLMNHSDSDVSKIAYTIFFNGV